MARVISEKPSRTKIRFVVVLFMPLAIIIILKIEMEAFNGLAQIYF